MIPSQAALIHPSFWDKSLPRPSVPTLQLLPSPSPTHCCSQSLSQRLLSTLPKSAVINSVWRGILEVTDSSGGPEYPSDVAEVARDTNGGAGPAWCPESSVAEGFY